LALSLAGGCPIAAADIRQAATNAAVNGDFMAVSFIAPGKEVLNRASIMSGVTASPSLVSAVALQEGKEQRP
jgi:hypothetical protein